MAVREAYFNFRIFFSHTYPEILTLYRPFAGSFTNIMRFWREEHDWLKAYRGYVRMNAVRSKNVRCRILLFVDIVSWDTNDFSERRKPIVFPQDRFQSRTTFSCCDPCRGGDDSFLHFQTISVRSRWRLQPHFKLLDSVHEKPEAQYQTY